MRETGEDEGDGKEKEQRLRRNLDHINCNNCGEKGHYAGNSKLPTQTNLKEDAKAFRKLKQEKSSNNSPGGGDQKLLVNVTYAFCSLMMGAPTKEWSKPPSPGLMFFQISTQVVSHTEPINNNTKNFNTSDIASLCT